MKSRTLSVATCCLLGAFALTPLGAAQAQTSPALPPPAAAKAASPMGAPTAEEVAARIQGFYDRTKTFKARFQQRYTIPRYNKQIDSAGQVVFQKPGKMSWRYTNNGNRVVADGNTIKVYEKENKQVFIQQMSKSQYPAALSFLVGGGDLRKSFSLRLLDAKQLSFEGGWVLEAKPKEPSPTYQTMLIYADAATNQVRRVLILDAQGNRNRFDFLEPVVNQAVTAGEFTFEPPAGTKIVKP
jgi:outer membrane lipoprotein carrier protein